MANFQRNPGSFRDPSGYVFSDGSRIVRTLNESGSLHFDMARSCGLLDVAYEKGLLIASQPVEGWAQRMSLVGARGETPMQAIEHPRIPLITYPYEWTFGQLRDAALQHLDLQLLALMHNFELSDATAYNMQFDVGLPRHIDVLSLRPYCEGRPWEGYNQFCRQFLYPLLLEHVLGIPFQRWYRGSINGIEIAEIMQLIPAWRRYTSLNLLMHVQLQAKAIKAASSSNLSGEAIRLPVISKAQYRSLLEGLRDWIKSMAPKRLKKTFWADYASINSYSEKERSEKHAFVTRAVQRWCVGSLLDVGGNSAEYSEVALAGGVSHVYCIDGDVDALEIAYKKRKNGVDGLLPLVMNWADPSPSQGWASRERYSFKDRVEVDAVMALAVVHHIVLGGNVPLSDFVDQLFSYGRKVIVEFVPKSDPMVEGLLRNREDIFFDYTEDNFIRLLERHSEIEEVCRVRDNGRVLFACACK